MLGSCAVNVVALPSPMSHLPLNVPPTPVVKGVNTKSFGAVSFNGEPKKPQTTPALVVGVTSGPAWICALVRLSLMSFGVCVPVTSMLKIVAVNVMNDAALSMKKLAVPNDAGRGWPPAVVGTVGGFSLALFRVAERKVCAPALPASTERSRALAIFGMAASRCDERRLRARGFEILRARSGFVDAVATRATRGKRRSRPRQAALAPGLAASTTKRAAVVTALAGSTGRS